MGSVRTVTHEWFDQDEDSLVMTEENGKLFIELRAAHREFTPSREQCREIAAVLLAFAGPVHDGQYG